MGTPERAAERSFVQLQVETAHAQDDTALGIASPQVSSDYNAQCDPCKFKLDLHLEPTFIPAGMDWRKLLIDAEEVGRCHRRSATCRRLKYSMIWQFPDSSKRKGTRSPPFCRSHKQNPSSAQARKRESGTVSVHQKAVPRSGCGIQKRGVRSTDMSLPSFLWETSGRSWGVSAQLRRYRKLPVVEA